MRKNELRRLLLWALFFLFWLIPGTIRVQNTPVYRYVKQADVTFYQGQRQQTMTYLQPQKLSSILTWLRILRPRGKVDSAQAIPDSHHYRIILHFSDGSQNVYHLQDYSYFSKDAQLWQKVRTTQAQMLYPLLHLLPPDG